jgi:PKD repeat protein
MVALLLLVPVGLASGSTVPAPIGAPNAAAEPTAMVQTRAALASLADSGPRTISPDPWTNLTPGLNASPSPREGEALVYDPAGPYVLLFGGASGRGALHDTWTFADGRWTNLSSNLSTQPSSRYKAVVTYDAADGYVLLFSGHAGTYFNDTWKWENGAWTELFPTLAPSAREDSMMAYDPADGYVVLFGGENLADHLMNDTWTYLGGTWTNISSTLHHAPPTREAGSMIWDSTDGYILLFGGSNDPRGDLRDSWSYLGGVWTNLTNLSASTPSKRETLMLADDPIDGFALLFGGLKFPTSLADSWAYNNGTWTQLLVGNAPLPSWGAEVVWDANGGRGFVLLFGGVSSPYANATYYGYTWTFKVPLAANVSVAGPTVYDIGGRTNLTLAAQGGYPSYTYGWLGLPAGCTSANSSTLSCQPAAAGFYNVSGWVMDSAGTNVTTAPVLLQVTPLPAVTGVLSPLAGNAPLAVTFNSTVVGGTPPFTYAWQFGDGGSSDASSGLYTFASAGVYTPVLNLQDADGAVSTAPTLPTITVKPALTATVTASPTSGLVPLTVDFSADVNGGWAPYSYDWAFGPAGATSTEVAPSYTFLTVGTYLVTVNVTDTLGAQVLASTTVSVLSALPLIASASASSTVGAVPLNITLQGSASGGTAPYSYSWSFGDSSAALAGATVSHSYTTVGNYTATLTVTDNTGATAQATVAVQATAASAVPIPFNASFAAQVGSPYCAAGTALAAISLTATAEGGTAPYAFSWVVGTTTATGPSATVTVPAGATTSLFLNASDSDGHVQMVSHSASVVALSCSTSSGQGSTTPNYLLILLIVLVAIVVAVEIALLVRRKP